MPCVAILEQPWAKSHRARRVNFRKSCQARDRFLRYDGPGTVVPGLLFSAADIAGDAAGWQGRPGSMMGSDNGNITIGHVWGIPIRINPESLLILALVDLDAGESGRAASGPRTRS